MRFGLLLRTACASCTPRCAVAWTAAATLAVLLLVCVSGAHAAPLGQWVWTRADVAPLSAARAQRPDVLAAVHVAELRFERGEPRVRLRLSPGTAAARVVVVRFDASFHAAWSAAPAAWTPALSAALGRVLALSRSTAPDARVLQLDYDCPTQHLAAWAALLSSLRAQGVFSGWELWLTSLIAQLREPGFGGLFRGLLAGHVVQVFDTGEPASARAETELLALLARAGLPFCVGIGAFERAARSGSAPVTQHAAWWDAMPALARAPGFRGTWVFAAGQRWTDRLGGLP